MDSHSSRSGDPRPLSRLTLSNNPYASPPLTSSRVSAVSAAKEIPFVAHTAPLARIVLMVASVGLLVCGVFTFEYQPFGTAATFDAFAVPVVCLVGSVFLAACAMQKQVYDENGIHTLVWGFRVSSLDWRRIRSWAQSFPDSWPEVRLLNGRKCYLNSFGSMRSNIKIGKILEEILSAKQNEI